MRDLWIIRRACRARRRIRGLAVATACLVAWPCAAQTWTEFVASFGSGQPPADVLTYLKRHPLVEASPQPRFKEIRTETVDGAVAQHYRLVGFENGFGRLEGVREERKGGTRRSGAQTISMTTALGGLILVALDNRTTHAKVFLRKIELAGELMPPAPDRTLSMRYERVQLADDLVIEEAHDCALTWTAPAAREPLLTSRCSGSTRMTRPAPSGVLAVSTSPEDSSAVFAYRPDLGWIFNKNTRVLEFNR